MGFVVGVDVGGTFTDSVVVSPDGSIATGKALSTPEDFSEGVMASVRSAIRNLGLSLEEVLRNCDYFCHGTTVAENALLTRTGARAGLITTLGFEDTLLIMRGKGRVAGLGEEAVLHPVKTNKPEPIIPRSLIEGILERMDYKGTVVVPLNEASLARAVEALMKKGVESVGVCLLWSFKNPEHERKVRDFIKARYPQVHITLSSDLAPLMGEYERTATTAINAYTAPITARYLASLMEKLKAHGFNSILLIMQAYGGLVPYERAAENSVAQIESGPVAGVMGSRILASRLGYSDVIAADMGGTTFKVGIIKEGMVQYASEPVIAQYNIMVPRLDIVSIGAGGGSIAWLDPVTKALRVGPKSAGAKPGPVCYGLGGKDPTVTDANLLLGYLNPDYFLGGEMKLHKGRTVEAFKATLCKELGMEPEGVAQSIYRIANAQMADLIRKVTVERGHDPREFVLFSYGGASSIHCCSYSRELGIDTIVVPSTAPVNCAFGVVASEVVHEYGLSDRMTVPADPKRVSENFSKLEAIAYDELMKEGFSREQISLSRLVEIRYRRQVHQIPTPVPLKEELTDEDMEGIYRSFEELYEASYGKGTAYREAGMELVNFRLRAVGMAKRIKLEELPREGRDAKGALKERRKAYSELDDAFISMPIYKYSSLRPGNVVEGPAIIEAPSTTILVDGDRVAEMDGYRNVIMRLRR